MNINKIIEKVCNYYHVDNIKKTRKRHVVYARKKIIYLARTYTNYTYEEIGRKLGVNHVTSSYHFKNFKNELEMYDDINSEFNKLKRDVFGIYNDAEIKETELIEFAIYLTGHDKAMIEKMYRDWKKQKLRI